MSRPPKSPILQTTLDEVDRIIRTAHNGTTPVLWLSGAQGSGKSTVTEQLVAQSEFRIGLLALDDFYMTAKERKARAADLSPLFATRGPPGTHDTDLLKSVISTLKDKSRAEPVQIPVFDKIKDDRREEWRLIAPSPDLIMVEGWLCGVAADHQSLNAPPMNSVEQKPGADEWRRYQEQFLENDYQPLWQDGFFMHLLAPDFNVVHGWRWQQEVHNYARQHQVPPPGTEEKIAVFIEHYERLTRRLLEGGRSPGMDIYIGVDRAPITVDHPSYPI